MHHKRLSLLTLVGLLAILCGCATPSLTRENSSFTFVSTERPGEWKERYWDFVQIARDYVKQQRIKFDIEKARPALIIGDDGRTIVATVLFDMGVGKEFLTVVIGADGKVLRHRLAIDKS